MNRYIITLLLLLYFVGCFGQSEKTSSDENWEVLLNDVKIKYGWSLKYGVYLPKPKFGDQLKAMEGQEITVRGFFLSMDVTGSVFVISNSPMSSCFFCGESGIESIIEILANSEETERFDDLKTDEYIEVKGTLQLNAKDYEHLVYILKDAKYVKTVK